MTNIRNIGLLIVLALAVSAFGCKKAKKDDPQPTEQSEARLLEPKPEDADTEVAEGDVRDAMLALQRVHFGFDSADLNEDSRNALTEAAKKLADKAKVHLYVEGHADETGETEYNLQLGERRAKTVRDFLSRSGVGAERLHIVSFGEEKPLAEGSGSEALAENRRVDFRLMRGDVELVLEASKPITE